MAKTVTIDEFLLTVRVPQKLQAKEYRAIRRTLTGARFQAALERALREVIQRYPSLSKVRFTILR